MSVLDNKALHVILGICIAYCLGAGIVAWHGDEDRLFLIRRIEQTGRDALKCAMYNPSDDHNDKFWEWLSLLEKTRSRLQSDPWLHPWVRSELPVKVLDFDTGCKIE
jgi:hypothetical protein